MAHPASQGQSVDERVPAEVGDTHMAGSCIRMPAYSEAGVLDQGEGSHSSTEYNHAEGPADCTQDRMCPQSGHTTRCMRMETQLANDVSCSIRSRDTIEGSATSSSTLRLADLLACPWSPAQTTHSRWQRSWQSRRLRYRDCVSPTQRRD